MNAALFLTLFFQISFTTGMSRHPGVESHAPLTKQQKERIHGIAQQTREVLSVLPAGEEKDRLAMSLAALVAESGDIAEAREIAGSSASDETRGDAFVAIAKAQASNRDFAGALDTTSSIGQDSKRTEAILSIITIQAESKDFSGATQAAGRLSDQPASYARALVAIATGQTEGEQKSQALATLSKALEFASGITTCGLGSLLMCRTELMTEIAMAQFHAGDAVEAEKTINLVQQGMAQGPQEERFFAATQLAIAEQELGHADRAKELLAGMPGGQFAEAFSGLQAVGEAAQTGDVKAIKGAAESISNPEQRSFAQFALAGVYIEKGEGKAALDILRSLKPLSRRAEFASEMAQELAGKGKFSEADEALKIGMSAAEVEENETTTQELSAAAVQVRASAGDADGARTKAELLKEPAKRAEAVRNAAKALALKGKDDDVLKWSGAESAPLIRASLLLGLAEGIASEKPEDTKKRE